MKFFHQLGAVGVACALQKLIQVPGVGPNHVTEVLGGGLGDFSPARHGVRHAPLIELSLRLDIIEGAALFRLQPAARIDNLLHPGQRLAIRFQFRRVIDEEVIPFCPASVQHFQGDSFRQSGHGGIHTDDAIHNRTHRKKVVNRPEE